MSNLIRRSPLTSLVLKLGAGSNAEAGACPEAAKILKAAGAK